MGSAADAPAAPPNTTEDGTKAPISRVPGWYDNVSHMMTVAAQWPHAVARQLVVIFNETLGNFTQIPTPSKFCNKKSPCAVPLVCISSLCVDPADAKKRKQKDTYLELVG